MKNQKNEAKKKISKLPENQGSIFAKMDRFAAQPGVVNLAHGFPDFEPDKRLIEALNQISSLGGCHQYAPPEGVLLLREAICSMMLDLYGLSVDPIHQVTVTAGATQAIFTLVQTLINKGDEVILFEPAFESYRPAIRLAGGIPVPLALNTHTYLPDWEAVETRITSKTKLVIINTPHNPSGTCWPLEDLQRMGQLAEKYNLWVLSDEVYHNITFAPNHHHPIWKIPELVDRATIVGSLGKTLHVTGWRIGYAITPSRLTMEFRKLHQFIVYAVATPLQHAMAAMLTTRESYTQLSSVLKFKRDLFLSGLEGSRFVWRPSMGTYFQLVDYSAISESTDQTFAEMLIADYGLMGIPLSGFLAQTDQSHNIRFCFAKRNETLEQATTILRNI